MIYFVTVSDDRFGRKDGLYSDTQDRITELISPMVDGLKAWKWEDIIKTDFYLQNKTLLDNTDAARNGRAYKPFVILEGLNRINEEDFLIYNDCSPELWQDVNISGYDIEVIKQLCVQANDILVPFIRWGSKTLMPGELGEATHSNYTLNRCMDRMGLRFYEDAYMCASGMICIRKTDATVSLITEWLKWNCIDECCALGYAHIPDDASFWEAESHPVFGTPGYKLGCRHDQSILGLLLAKSNHRFVEAETKDVHFANFLQYCRPDASYTFTECLPVINKGDTVINKQGTKLTVFDIHDNKFIVGVSNASMYATHRQNLKLI